MKKREERKFVLLATGRIRCIVEGEREFCWGFLWSIRPLGLILCEFVFCFAWPSAKHLIRFSSWGVDEQTSTGEMILNLHCTMSSEQKERLCEMENIKNCRSFQTIFFILFLFRKLLYLSSSCLTWEYISGRLDWTISRRARRWWIIQKSRNH